MRRIIQMSWWCANSTWNMLSESHQTNKLVVWTESGVHLTPYYKRYTTRNTLQDESDLYLIINY